jgi:ATP-dependent Zn protease
MTKAESLLKENEHILDRLASALLEKESLNAQQIEEIVKEDKIAVELN